jgi:hypothetical protein
VKQWAISPTRTLPLGGTKMLLRWERRRTSFGGACCRRTIRTSAFHVSIFARAVTRSVIFLELCSLLARRCAYSRRRCRRRTPTSNRRNCSFSDMRAIPPVARESYGAMWYSLAWFQWNQAVRDAVFTSVVQLRRAVKWRVRSNSCCCENCNVVVETIPYLDSRVFQH